MLKCHPAVWSRPSEQVRFQSLKTSLPSNIQVSLFFYALAWQNSLVIDLENISSVPELLCLRIYFWDAWHGRARPPRHAIQPLISSNIRSALLGLVLWHRLARLLNSYSQCSFHWSVNGKSLSGLASSWRSQWNLSWIQILGFCFRTISCVIRWLTNSWLSWAIALYKSQQSTKPSLRRKTLPPWLFFDYSKDDSCSIRMPLHVEHLHVSFDLFRDAPSGDDNIPSIARNSLCLDQMLCGCFKCSVRTDHLYEASSSSWSSSVSAKTHYWEEFFAVFERLIWFVESSAAVATLWSSVTNKGCPPLANCWKIIFRLLLTLLKPCRLWWLLQAEFILAITFMR